MTQERIKEVIALHEDWLNDKIGGVRADLREADLSGAFLSGADLSGADLSGADLSGANLSGADLRDADLRRADLRRADLSGADLSGTFLGGIWLKDTKGDGKCIKSIRTEIYSISYTASVLQIGCKNHLISEWVEFDDKKISRMDSGALEWWKKWKSTIMQTIERDPCEPTRG